MNKAFIIIIGFTLGNMWQSCGPAEGNNTGHEYMSDMAHSVAVEANVDNYYYYHTWDSKENYRKYSRPLLPVKGTIARGFAGISNSDSISLKMATGELSNNAIHTNNNGSVPYYYANTEEERARAGIEITRNVLPLTKKGLMQGKQLYDIYCGICHGEKGDGAGYLVRDDGGLYPAQPANFLKDEFIASTEGRFYHGIMHGKNVMTSYADKLSYEERWNVIHYIRSLQANSKNLKYSETGNTFTGSQAIIDAKKAAVPTNVVVSSETNTSTKK